MYTAPDYIALAVPVFFLLIGLELLFQRLRGTKLYRFNDALTNISCGIGQQVLGALMKTVLFAAYIFLFERVGKGLNWFPESAVWAWVLLFVGVDFFYYWFHRYAHEISLLWGGHVVHHQSEEYNLSVALRQGAFQAFFSWVFYLPLALLGFSPVMFLVINQFVTLYQFWIHTEAIRRLPAWFEWLFNTPSHHRVHHGVNPKYIDKNHGGTFIIWDRLFGTFQAEDEEVVYGVTKPVQSWNAVWLQVVYFVELWALLRRCRSLGDVWRVLWKGPGWQPDYLGGPQKPGPVSRRSFRKWDTQVPSQLNSYVLLQYVLVLAVSTVFLFLYGKGIFGWQWGLVLAGFIYLSISGLGLLLEGRAWAFTLELVRLLVLAGLGAAWFWDDAEGLPWSMAVLGWTAVSLIWLRGLAGSPAENSAGSVRGA